MKTVISISLFLFCVAGFLVMTKQKNAAIQASGHPQAVKITNNLSAINIDRLSVSDGFATFEVKNVSGEPLTAVVIHSGRYRAVIEMSHWDNKIDPGEKRTLGLNIDGTQPLTVDAVIYQSGKADGNQLDIEKVRNTRQGFKIGLAMIQGIVRDNGQVASIKT